MKKPDRGWSLLDHTADIRLEVVGETIEELFLNAARGITQLLAEPLESAPSEEVDVHLEAETIDDLLVDWLRELLFLNRTQGFVFIRAHHVDLSGASLKARLIGRKLGSNEIPPFDVKAVTYHDASIRHTPRGYVTRIVFDI